MIRIAWSRLLRHPAVTLPFTFAAAALGVLAEGSPSYFLACGLYVVSVTAIDAARRRDLGALACLGWPGRALAGVVLAEALMIAALAGILAAAATLVLPGGHAPAPPVTVLIVLLTGAVLAVRAARTRPAAVLEGEHA